MNARGPGQSWVPIAGFIVVVAGIVWQGGTITSQVQRNTADIAALKAAQQTGSSDLNSINVRTARIEAKLDLLTPRVSQ